MRFIGIDLAWGTKNTSGAVALEGITEAEGGLTTLRVIGEADRLHTDDDILDFVRAHDAGVGLMIGVDAPLDVPNETGERPVESALRRCFQRFQAGAHPANRSHYAGDIRGERLVRRLEAEFQVVPHFALTPGDPTARRCIEVFPHPATITLFGLTRTLKYKARPGRDMEQRMAAFGQFIAGLESLRDADPALVVPDWLRVPDDLRGLALKRFEDRMDGLMCAYIAAHWWRWGEGERAMTIGDKATGYVVTPITPELRACVELFFADRAGPAAQPTSIA